MSRYEPLLQLRVGNALFRREFGEEIRNAFGPRRTRQHRVHGHAGSGDGLREAARDRKLGGLGHSVVNHLDRNVERRFARNEDNAPPAPADHEWQVVPRQANSAHDIRVKKTLPIFVRDLAERLWFEYPKIVHEDIGFGYALYQSGHTRRGREIGGDACTLTSGTCCASRLVAASTLF
jgi:hypothetical protein